jgi:hypothetical protein
MPLCTIVVASRHARVAAVLQRSDRRRDRAAYELAGRIEFFINCACSTPCAIHCYILQRFLPSTVDDDA